MQPHSDNSVSDSSTNVGSCSIELPVRDLSIIIPTYNERDNIEPLTRRLQTHLDGNVDYEIIVVDDDSPDQTWALAETLSKADPRLRVLRRTTKKGLASAVVDGFSSATGNVLAVIDADLQHDESILLSMHDQIANHDIVVGSRKVAGGGISQWNPLRRLISWFATQLARRFLRVPIADPMSGYFMLRREVFNEVAPKINPTGFKILLEIARHADSPKIAEVGYLFRPRQFGKSKLSVGPIFAYLGLIYDATIEKILPMRLIKFCIVGLSGVFVNLGILYLFANLFALPKEAALIPAIAFSILSNYTLNNFWTFRDQVLRSWNAFTIGAVKYAAICSAGSLMNYAAALLLCKAAGMNLYLADIGGICLATIWNYCANARYTWRSSKGEPELSTNF